MWNPLRSDLFFFFFYQFRFWLCSSFVFFWLVICHTKDFQTTFSLPPDHLYCTFSFTTKLQFTKSFAFQFYLLITLYSRTIPANCKKIFCGFGCANLQPLFCMDIDFGLTHPDPFFSSLVECNLYLKQNFMQQTSEEWHTYRFYVKW